MNKIRDGQVRRYEAELAPLFVPTSATIAKMPQNRASHGAQQ
jgi:hypothetical protein